MRLTWGGMAAGFVVCGPAGLGAAPESYRCLAVSQGLSLRAGNLFLRSGSRAVCWPRPRGRLVGVWKACLARLSAGRYSFARQLNTLQEAPGQRCGTGAWPLPSRNTGQRTISGQVITRERQTTGCMLGGGAPGDSGR